ncbi:hypothetical protein ACQRET_03530 [Streptomyces koyangensis]|uniref:hypothetical protein n=1 Tax=Streptomyces koyangensis TaxID=188770 RepID=UPI003D0023AE
MTTPETEQPRIPPMDIPGVRYVKRKVVDLEATTLDGETTYREVERTVRVPAPPRDWDLVLVRGLIGGALLVTALSLVWSTDSIGSLLDRKADAFAAYGAAVIFDVAWLSCQAREWLDRRDPERAKIPRRFGYLFLVVTMVAIGVHGHVEGELESGLVGAAVSALAKGMWINALGYYAVPLDPGMAHHLLTRRRRIAVKLAVSRERRELAAMEAYEGLLYGQQSAEIDVEREPGTPLSPAVPSLAAAPALPASAAPALPAAPAVFPAPAAPVSPPVPVAPASASPTVPAAPPAPASPVSPAVPASVVTPASPAAPAVPPAPVSPPVPTAPAPVYPAVPPAPAAAPASHAPMPEAQSAPLHAVGGPPVGKTAFIRSVLAETPGIDLDDLTAKVRARFGDKPDLRKDVRRLRSRIEGRAS